MKIGELFKSTNFIIGLILGIFLLYLIVNESMITGFHSEFIFYYFVILMLILVTVGETKAFYFFIGIGIPYLIIVLMIFSYVDFKNRKK